MQKTAQAEGKRTELTKTQKWIVNALLDLMQQKDYAKITVREITNSAEVARATFYLNFESKDDVLNQYIETLYTEFRRRLNEVSDPSAYSLARTYFSFWQERLDFVGILLRQGLFFQLLSRHEYWLRDLFGTRDEKKMLTLRFEDPRERDFFAVYQAGGLWHLLKRWAESGGKESPEYLSTVFAKILG